MEICALASGSSGNCFYVANDKCSILIDAGISAKQIVERLNLIKKDPEDIEGIFITHEHSDHVKGSDVFARKFNVPIFATKGTVFNGFLCSNPELINIIRNNETLKIKGMEVTAFSKSHGAADPVSYSVVNNKKISIITDAGYGCDNIISNVSDSDFLCLESNHDRNMLDNGPYPWPLKKLVGSDRGHLSNMQAALCVLEHGSQHLKHVMLSHLSKINNTPEIALNTFKILKERKDLNCKVTVSTREMITPIFKI
ncbi:MAG TPA: MBL fold metallo-hydrolase [Candidatus Paceibacterota bacterium]|nr:MBL fold metallo-hydrolase [Candidatus Paceibacterota bacterium]